MPRLVIVPERSTIVVEARSSVGPIAWEAVGPTGEVELALGPSGVEIPPLPSGYLELDLARLTSGNRVYDAELLRRLDADRHPSARVELGPVESVGQQAYAARGQLTFHGTTRPVGGTVDVELRDDGSLLLTGQQVLDIRDFGVPAPTMLMLKIYPDVRVHLVIEAAPRGDDTPADARP